MSQVQATEYAPAIPLKRKADYRHGENILGWVMAAPWLIGFACFTVGPMVISLGLSLTDWNLLSPAKFAGLANYRRMLFEDKLVVHSVRITFSYALGSIPLHIALGLSLALLLNASVKGLSLYRTIFYLPAVLSGVASALLWRWIFSPEFGLLNQALAVVGITGPNWLNSRQWVIPSFIVMSLWGVGGSMIIYLSAIQGVPTVLHEAAIIDGAGWWRRIVSITLPLISPVILFQLVMGIIGGLQVFVGAFIMTAGGPANASLFYMLHLYRQGFQYFRMGYASALAWFLFSIIMALTLLVFRSSPTWVYYEAELKGRQ